jgi:photosystem II stability/assembly factor-like uncharacterized protein
MTSWRVLAFVLATSALGAPALANASETPAPAASAAASPFTGLTYRLLGPFRGGRATGVTGVVGDPNTYYFGAAAGGVWKTTDSGISWKPLWDHFPEAAPAVGSVAVAPSDPKIVYAGTGEENIRGNVVTGNGLYKSTDAGKTWALAGLADSQVIGRIIIDPKDPNTVFVAALGHAFGENPERGVFKSTDGGKTWRKVLYGDERTGASDVRFDPTDSKVMWAGLWRAYRKPWIMESGGSDSDGLYKSVDGGETWTHLTGGGLPEGPIGRVNVAPTSDPKRVYAMIEAHKGGLYRTDDGGKTWTLINDKNDYRQRAWYFNGVFADPKSPDTVYVLNTSFYKSTDAGKTFKIIRTPHGDNHELWIDPANPARMINSNDGGADISVNGGTTWSSIQNQPTAQFYHVAADNDFPFHLLGAQQDNSTIEIATAGRSGGVGIEDWWDVGGGESGYVVPDPTDGNIVYASGYGSEITRYDHRTGEERQITPWPRNTMGWAPKDLEYRFQWTPAILLSNFAPHELYFAANLLFRSTDQGQSWTVISPDLTRNDKDHQLSSGGPITKDNTSIETFGTIFSVAESPKMQGLIWAGSDDGLIHLTRDDGAHWEDVSPKALPDFATVDMIEPDPRDPGTAYVAADRHRLDDFHPYALITRDYGQTWTSIAQGLPDGAYVHVVRADPTRAGLLFAGTERGIYVSYDTGAHWTSLQLNLPVVPVHDLVVHGNSLGVATHGRAFWVLDDLSAIRQWSDGVAAEKVHLFAPAVANHTVFPSGGGGGAGGLRAGGGANPPGGAVITYSLSSGVGTVRPADTEPKSDEDKAKDDKDKAPDPYASRLKLEILDSGGKVIRVYPDPKAIPPDPEEERGRKPPSLTHFVGLNSFVWDERYEGATPIAHAPLWAGSLAGPKAVPGHYQVRLTVDGVSQTQPLEIAPDPRLSVTQADLEKQFQLHAAINAKLTEVNDAVLAIRAAREAVLAGKPSAKAQDLAAQMTAIEEVLIQPRAHASEDALNYPVQLNNMLAALGSLVGSSDARPTDQEVAMFQELSAKADVELAKWAELKKTAGLAPPKVGKSGRTGG